jgi:hypothetical protein
MGNLAITGLWKWGVPLAAGIVVLGGGLVVVTWWNPPAAGPFPPARAGLPPDRGVHPPHRSELSAPPAEFRWPAVDGADTYWVVLYDHESTVVWESVGTPDPVVAFPESMREVMPMARYYDWTVSADVGEIGIDSPRYRFRLIPPEP